MKFRPLPLAGAYVIEPEPRRDERGFFVRLFCADLFRQHGLVDRFVQTNHSMSLRRGTIRGLHYQSPPREEAKLLRCLRGAVQDVMVDLRRGSATFLHWHGEVLRADDLKAVYIPAGFAHGYQALEDGSAVTYDASAPYTPELEGAIRHDEPRVGILWQVPDVIVSPKDATTAHLDDRFTGIDL
jgi:dTDP-4-dehydrorhamnose 3,5-epimerase